MSISALFIRRPVMTTLVMSGILIFGVMAYRQLPVSDLPNVDFPTITVSANLSGASPETMASAVATPLEKQLSTIAGVDQMVSSSSQGSTNITLTFNLSRDIDAAAQDVQAALSRTQRSLPRDVLPPSFQKINPADQPILYLALRSTTLPLTTLNEFAEGFLAQRFSMIPGVAQVNIFGSQKYAVRIRLDPQAMAARGIGIDEVAAAVGNANVSLPNGVLWGAHRVFTVQANGELATAREFRPIVVAYRNGSPIRLEDLGQVVDSVQNDKSASWFSGTRAIMLAISKQPGTNTVAVADAVHALLERLTPQLPAGVDIRTLSDRSQSIRASVHDVKITMMVTLVLVILVIFLFLRNVSATVIPSLALPMSIVGTFAVMFLLGYSLDNLSLMALTLSVGFVVDDAIVMLENIVRHMEMGKPRMQAALEGAKEIGFTIVSMTLSLTAVFIPLLFMGGIVGRLFREFAVTIGVAILVSGFVSLTLTPMMCSRFLKPPREQHHGQLFAATERVYQRTLGFYQRTLGWVMEHRRVALAFSAAILAGTVWLFVAVPKGFIPSEDTGNISGSTEMAEGTSFADMVRHQQQIADILRADSNVVDFMSSVGGGNNGRLQIRLKPRSERDLDADGVIRVLQRKLAVVPGIQVFLSNPPPIRVGGRVSKSLYQFVLQSPDIDGLYEGAALLERRMRDLSILQDVTSDLQIRNPQVRVEIDRDRASSLGLTVAQIESALYDAYGTRQVSTILTPDNQYAVIMELLPQYQRDYSAINLLYVRSRTGALVPVGAVASLKPAVGPLSVNHSGQLPSITLSFNLRPGVSIGQAVDAVQSLAGQTLPSSITTAFGGTAQAFQASQSGLNLLLLLAVLVIYLVLGVLYESFIHPLTILSGLPFAGFGALLTLLIFKTELSVYAFVGVIMLVGLVKKNAIMMIDFAVEAERSEGKSARDAIVEACSIRFRPIMMTTMAALMGTLPIALGWGAGAESRRPLGLAVVGGLAVSQIITLYVTPVFYTYLDGLQSRFKRRARTPVLAEAPTAQAAD
ncbi:MAG: efflux RND transporter permease subunit [Gemmatimonadales bacterium]|nr:efflux RND transporter permease subunit [Gemmatimonadales bacterium]